MFYEEKEAVNFTNELMVCCKLNHPNIVITYEFFLVKNKDLEIIKVYIIMELLQYSLRDFIGFSTEKKTQLNIFDGFEIIQDICKGLLFLKEQHICYYDLKT